MTTIIGIEYQNKAILAADSLTTDEKHGRRYKHKTIPKISKNKDFLIAGSGLAFVCDVVQQAWVPPSPTPTDKKNLYKFMINKAIPSLKKTLHEYGYERTPVDHRGDDADFNFLMAVNGELFEVDDDYGILKSEDGFYAVGSGAPFALGALYAGADWEECLQIACKLSVYSEPPFIYFEQVKTRGKDD